MSKSCAKNLRKEKPLYFHGVKKYLAFWAVPESGKDIPYREKGTSREK
jgi:hypothetical protein